MGGHGEDLWQIREVSVVCADHIFCTDSASETSQTQTAMEVQAAMVYVSWLWLDVWLFYSSTTEFIYYCRQFSCMMMDANRQVHGACVGGCWDLDRV